MLLRFHGNCGRSQLGPDGGQRKEQRLHPGGLGRASSLSLSSRPGVSVGPSGPPRPFRLPPRFCAPRGHCRGLRDPAEPREAQSRALRGLCFGASLGAACSRSAGSEPHSGAGHLGPQAGTSRPRRGVHAGTVSAAAALATCSVLPQPLDPRPAISASN